VDILCLCTSVVDHFVTIMRVKLLLTIHQQNIRLETDVCSSFSCELVCELILAYHNNSYSVAYEERFVVIHVPCLKSRIMVMLLVKNTHSEVGNCFRIVSIFS